MMPTCPTYRQTRAIVQGNSIDEGAGPFKIIRANSIKYREHRTKRYVAVKQFV